MHLALVDTALELVPESGMREPCVSANIKKFGTAGYLLDTALHHSYLSTLPDADRRGRPDILHHFLLDALGSVANSANQLQIWFHTRQGFYQVDSQMRCPRDYLRFKALMVQLLQHNQIPPDATAPFIRLVPDGLNQWISSTFPISHRLLLSSHGQSQSISSFFTQFASSHEPFLVIIGGFQKGSISFPIQSLFDIQIALGNQSYDSWTIINRVLALYELNLGLLQ